MASSKAVFNQDDPLLLDAQLSDEERAVADATRAAVNTMAGLAGDYATVTNAQINKRIRTSPVQGIIDL